MLPSEERIVVISSLGRMILAPVELSGDAVLGNQDPHSSGRAKGSAHDHTDSGHRMEEITATGASDLSQGGFHVGPILAASLAKERPVMVTVCADDNRLGVGVGVGVGLPCVLMITG